MRGSTRLVRKVAGKIMPEFREKSIDARAEVGGPSLGLCHHVMCSHYNTIHNGVTVYNMEEDEACGDTYLNEKKI